MNNNKTRNKVLFHIGNSLILLSILSILFVYFPLLDVYFFPPEQHIIKKQGIFISIPKIHAYAPVVENVDPWNEKLYQEKLKMGVAHAKGTSLPGEKGTSFLFAHSSDLPWNITRYNTAFFRLSELQQGDTIELMKDGEKFVYKVVDRKEVSPSEVKYLQPQKKDQLILQTCTPPGTSLKRLLIFAERT